MNEGTRTKKDDDTQDMLMGPSAKRAVIMEYIYYTCISAVQGGNNEGVNALKTVFRS